MTAPILIDESVVAQAVDATLAFFVNAAVTNSSASVPALAESLGEEFPEGYPGHQVFRCWSGETATLPPLQETIVIITREILSGEHLEPQRLLIAGLRMFEWIDQAGFKYLLPRLAASQRENWQRILSKETFRLSRPLQTAPPIEQALASPSDDRQFLARLFLAALEAVRLPIADGYTEKLRAIAEGRE